MSDKMLTRNNYLSQNKGFFDQSIEINGIKYEKVEDLRYGTNPHQPAAFYRPIGIDTPIGNMKVLKTGKNGLSQTNLEDISYAINIIKFFKKPAVAVMKHVNPSGVAAARENESLKKVYIKARDCDPRAAFGSTIAFNYEVNESTAAEIMSTFNECVVAPAYTESALKIFNDNENYKINKHIRILQCGNINSIPKFIGEAKKEHQTIKIIADGSLIIAEPLLTNVKSFADIHPALAENNVIGKQISTRNPTNEQLEDILTAWYININVRSNGVVIVKNGQTLSVGTGEQDRVGAVEQAIAKFNEKYKGCESLQNAVMSSDGFFPFYDGIEIAAQAGISAIIAPSGSVKDAEVIKRANELNVALLFAPERIFSHH